MGDSIVPTLLPEVFLAAFAAYGVILLGVMLWNALTCADPLGDGRRRPPEAGGVVALARQILSADRRSRG